ncbi:hypothetical protein CXT95_00670 [Akkermansia muciniphila]|uniref:XRE family transcriptional regulator n=1 Tax=Akkermansia muciniphila TaxID=239935 RepID=A0AAX0WM71_9BACT|nr:hypothetical protein CXT95_00670 [Akkermansia muciniphila]
MKTESSPSLTIWQSNWQMFWKSKIPLLYDNSSRFLAAPYTEALKNVRTAMGLSQEAFAEQIEIVPS